MDEFLKTRKEVQRQMRIMGWHEDALKAKNRYIPDDCSGDWLYGRRVEDLDDGTKAILAANPAVHPLCRTCPHETLCMLDAASACRTKLMVEDEANGKYHDTFAWLYSDGYTEDLRMPEEEIHTWVDLAQELYRHMTRKREQLLKRHTP